MGQHTPRLNLRQAIFYTLLCTAIASLVVGVLQLELDPSYAKFESCEELEESFEDNAPPEDGAPWLALNAPWDVVCPHYGCYNDDHTSSGYTPRDERCLGFGLKRKPSVWVRLGPLLREVTVCYRHAIPSLLSLSPPFPLDINPPPSVPSLASSCHRRKQRKQLLAGSRLGSSRRAM